MLRDYQLEQQLNTVREELSYALFQVQPRRTCYCCGSTKVTMHEGRNEYIQIHLPPLYLTNQSQVLGWVCRTIMRYSTRCDTGSGGGCSLGFRNGIQLGVWGLGVWGLGRGSPWQ